MNVELKSRTRQVKLSCGKPSLKNLLLVVPFLAYGHGAISSDNLAFHGSRTVVQFAVDDAYQSVTDSDVKSHAAKIKADFPELKLNEIQAQDLALASMAIAAHYDRIMVQPPHQKHVEAPKRGGRSYRADHIVNTALWKHRLHERDTDGCVFRRLIEGDTPEEQILERKKFRDDPNYKCNDQVTKPQEEWAIKVSYASWLTPVPDLRRPVSEEEVKAYRKENTPDKFLARYPEMRDLASKAWREGIVRFKFLNQEIPYTSGMKLESEAQAQRRFAAFYLRLLESLKFRDTPMGSFHPIELSRDITDLKDEQGNDVWGGPIILRYDNPAPRNVQEFRERTHEELTKWYVGLNRSKFATGLVFARKKGVIGLTPGPSLIREKAESEDLKLRDAEFGVLQFIPEGFQNREELFDQVNASLKELRGQITSGAIKSLEDLKAFADRLRSEYPKHIRIQLMNLPRATYHQTRYLPPMNLVEDFQQELLFEKVDETVKWAEQNDGQEILFVIALNRGETKTRKIQWDEDKIDWQIAEKIAISDGLSAELRKDFLKILEQSSFGVLPRPDLRELGQEYASIGHNGNQLRERMTTALKTLLEKSDASSFLELSVKTSPNLPRRFVCADRNMVMPTCKMTQSEWDAGGIRKGWFK